MDSISYATLQNLAILLPKFDQVTASFASMVATALNDGLNS
jgi:hypothetical protein